MKTIHRLAALLCLSLSPLSAEPFTFNGKTFTLPESFVMEQVAGPPQVDRPIMGDFDEQGRLYLADSSGSRAKIKEQLETRPHRIVRLEDQDGDGRFETSVVFADKMMFPEGILWHDGAVYCAAPPIIWKLEDTDGDGVADKRTKWHDGKTLTGCANDLHGPHLGPDGMLYWCKGAFDEQTYSRPRERTFTDRASHIYRCWPDKSGFDSVISGGMDNPVEIAFSPTAEAFFSTTFFVKPRLGQRDALVHAIYGSVFPKLHGVLDNLAKTGDLMPPLTMLDADVPCGLSMIESDSWGKEYQGNLFSAQFNRRRIQRHRLTPKGATFKTIDEDFLTCDHPEFHPTDIIEEPGGSLLIIDTGGWYKVCCPTAQIAKPEVLGAIYRIRKIDAKSVEDPWGLNLDWKTPETAWLGDHRPAVRKRAVEVLSKGPVDPVIRALMATKPRTRLNAVWTLTRMKDDEARKTIRKAMFDRDRDVRLAAIHATGLHLDRKAVPDLITHLKDLDPVTRRKAAEALGCIGDPIAISALLQAVPKGEDRALEHAVIFALIDMHNPDAITPLLKNASQVGKRAGETALNYSGLAAREAQTAQAPKPTDADLFAIARDPKKDTTDRLKALAGMKTPPKKLTPSLFTLVEQQLDPEAPMFERVIAIELLTRSRLSSGQLDNILQRVPNMSASSLSRILRVLTQRPDSKTLRALAGNDAFKDLPPPAWEDFKKQIPDALQDEADALTAKITAMAEGKKQRLDELQAKLGEGKAERGHLIFNSTKTGCISCHSVGYLGGTLGPDLSRISRTRTARDLLEAVVYPSTGIARGYEHHFYKTQGGVFHGIKKDENDTQLTIALGPGAKLDIERKAITDIVPSNQSLMPAGFDGLLTDQEIADLIVFLQTLK